MLKNCRAIAAVLWVMCGFFSVLAVASETKISPGSPFVTDVWETADKLPDDTVVSVIQSRDGYLWVGTLHGLARFDGLRFTSFDDKDLAGSRILYLFEDSHTNLWVGTDNTGIWIFKRSGEITRLSFGAGMAGGQLASASEDDSGTIWLKLGNNLVARYWNGKLEPVNGQFTFAVAEKNGPLWLAIEGALIPLITPPGSSAMIVQAEAQASVSDLKFLAAGKTEGLWRFVGGRVEKWKNNRRERDLGPYPWGDKLVMAACEDDHGNLIVGTYGDGVYWFDENGGYTHILSELTHAYILSLTFDNEGNLWIGTNGRGLNRIRRNPFSLLLTSQDKVVQSISADKHGGVWIGYNGNLVEHWNGSNSQVFKLVTNPTEGEGTYAKSVFVDKDERVFAGIFFQFQGPRLFQFETNRFAPENSISGANISAIHQDRAGRIWLGTQGGLVLFNGSDSKVFSIQDGLPSPDVHAIADDAEGNIWVGTSDGLACLKDGKITVYRKANGLPGDNISALLADSENVLWIGTRGSGLARFANHSWTYYSTSNGLGGDSIGYLLEDNETNLWLGSNSGLMRVAKKSLNEVADGTSKSIQCRVYVEEDGLPTRECTEGSQPAACATEDGRLWFPTTRGLVYVDPSALKQNLLEPPVIIESVLVDSVRQGTNVFGGSPSEILVPPGQRDLEIHYASLNLGAADRSRFRYRLNEQGEGPWVDDASGNRMANYPKLPPGTYQFEVTACNEDGVWSSHPAQLTVVVQPWLWQKTWFRVLLAAALLVAIAGLVYYFSTQKLQRQVELLRQQEVLEHERGRIARDLHDQLGANLTQVALLAEMAESDKNLPDEVEDHAKQITQTARETTKALDEIVWAVNPSNDTLEGLVNYSGKYAQEYFALAGLRYRVDIPSEVPDVTLPPEVRHNVFLAFKESVNNVVKHAQATEVHVRLKLEPDSFALEIEDNGKGPAGAEQKTGRNGLRNMRKRMEDVGGSFTLGPAPEKGTLVRLSAPIKNRTNAH
ncbi:MAG TPA: two-component regulator propeller domain-containing protein [Verrucomicrobiae bacterium]|nr:two-component regulator propeller domain-containing protein [Verrucomicrobiae bacterium]